MYQAPQPERQRDREPSSPPWWADLLLIGGVAFLGVIAAVVWEVLSR